MGDQCDAGNVAGLRALLAEHAELATARGIDPGCAEMSRALLHIAADWPGQFPNGPETVAALVEAGADIDARFTGPHTETPLDAALRGEAAELVGRLRTRGAKSAGELAKPDPGTPAP